MRASSTTEDDRPERDHDRLVNDQLDTLDQKAYLQFCMEEKIQPYMSESWREDLINSSPYQIDPNADIRKEFIKGMFFPNHTIWMGGVFDSGKPHHTANFKTVRDWLECPILPPRVAAGIFNEHTFSRSIRAVTIEPYIIIESDSMEGVKPETEADKERNKQIFHAFILYAQDKLDLKLRAVIDTANKSLHSYFLKPTDHQLDCLLHMAEAFNLDEGLIRYGAASPLRTPGCIHNKTNRPAELLYFHPNFL